jgi:hypothetical protein
MSNSQEVKVRVMETVIPIAKEVGTSLRGLYHSNQVAAFDYSERRAVFADRIMNCIARAFGALGASSATQEIIFWNLHVTRSLWRNEIVDKPAEFIEGLKAIYGDAGVAVFEYLLTREIKREFSLKAFEEEAPRTRGFVDLLHLAAHSSEGSQGNP